MFGSQRKPSFQWNMGYTVLGGTPETRTQEYTLFPTTLGRENMLQAHIKFIKNGSMRCTTSSERGIRNVYKTFELGLTFNRDEPLNC